MQKVIQRTVFAEKQAARRLAKKKEKAVRLWVNHNREQTLGIRKMAAQQLKDARQARIEDRDLGPLAPRRDVGDMKDAYGTINQSQLQLPEIHDSKRAEVLKSVGGRYLNIAKGDRVVLLDGRDKGKIGKITEIEAKRGMCKVEGLNMVDIAIPQWMRNLDKEDPRTVRSVEGPVSLTSVRLVYPLTDTESGETRDVIVKKLINTDFFYSKETGRTYWKRVIPGLDLVVPWPKNPPTERHEYNGDTLRIEVESRTFVPTLLRPPMPSSVINELRNKYSKFRTRHDPEYIEAKMQEDRDAEAKKKQLQEMRTPLKEINRRERKLRKAKGKGTLTADMLEQIGKVMARKRQFSLGPVESSIESAAVTA